MNSLFYAAFDVFFCVFSGMTLSTEKDFPSSVTTIKPSKSYPSGHARKV